MKVSAYDITFKEFGHQGYIVKIERPSSTSNNLNTPGPLGMESHLETPNNQLLPPLSTHKSSRRSKNNFEIEHLKKFFSLKYDISVNKYMGEIINLENQPELLKSIERLNKINENILISQRDFEDSSRIQQSNIDSKDIEDNSYLKFIKNSGQAAGQESKILSRFEENIKKNMGVTSGGPVINEDNKLERVDYGQGIRTMKLYSNRLYDPDDLKKEFARDSDEENSEGTNGEQNPDKKDEKAQQIAAEKEDEEEGEDLDDNSGLFKNREKFKNLISKENNKGFFPITRINMAGALIIIVLMSLGVVYFSVNKSQYDNVNLNYHILLNSNQMISDSQAILNRLHQLLMLNKGIYQDKTGEIGTAEKIKSSIKEYIVDLSNHQTFVQLNTFYLFIFLIQFFNFFY